MRVPREERGAALLTVLLLVAVMATVAATALDRIGVGTRFLANAATIAQARSWLDMAEQLAGTRIEDLLAADASQTTLAAGLLGAEHSIDLPDGSVAKVRIDDGGNCFNLNSLVQRLQDGRMIARPFAARQFTALMVSLGIGQGEAAIIAASATDYVDPDSVPLPGGTEDGETGPSANHLIAHASELRLVPNMTDRHFRLLERWICALPVAELSPINVNTLLAEQAPLVAMLVPGQIDVARARSQIAARPADGYGSVLNFWQTPVMAGLEVPPEAAEQIKVRTGFFILRVRVSASDIEVAETALFDARLTPVRLLYRQWGQSS